MTGELIRAYRGVNGDEVPRIWRFHDLTRYLEPWRKTVVPPKSWVVYTDYDNRLIMRGVLSKSLNWADGEYARRMMADSLAIGARHAFLVLFCGTERPELDEWELDYMLNLSRTLRTIHVELMDCVFAGEEGFVSMNRQGRMDSIRRESALQQLHERYCEEVLDDDADGAIYEGQPGTL